MRQLVFASVHGNMVDTDQTRGLTMDKIPPGLIESLPDGVVTAAFWAYVTVEYWVVGIANGTIGHW